MCVGILCVSKEVDRSINWGDSSSGAISSKVVSLKQFSPFVTFSIFSWSTKHHIAAANHVHIWEVSSWEGLVLKDLKNLTYNFGNIIDINNGEINKYGLNNPHLRRSLCLLMLVLSIQLLPLLAGVQVTYTHVYMAIIYQHHQAISYVTELL